MFKKGVDNMTVTEWFEQNDRYSEAIAVRPDGTEIGCWFGDEYKDWKVLEVTEVDENTARLVLNVPEGR